MPIDIPQPIVVPAAAEKVADKVWILTMNVNANDLTKPVKAYFSVAPYVATTGEVLRDKIEHINVDDVMTACATNPTLAQALGAIYQAVHELCKQRNLFGLAPDPIAPTITIHPIDIDAIEGEATALSIEATGSPLNYQWRKDGEEIEGANGQTLVFNPISESDEGVYDCVISNGAGVAESNDATVTVNPLEV
jgi:hypothetical protein